MAQPHPQMPQLPPQMPSQMNSPMQQLPQMPQIPQMPQMPTQIHQMQQMPQMPQQMPQAPQMPQGNQAHQQGRPAFSPTHPSPSPTGTPQQGFAMPPNKRPRTENGPASSQQQPTFLAQPYAMSPQTQVPQAPQAPQAPVASPGGYLNSPTTAPPQNYASPYANGGPPSLSMPTPAPAAPVLHMPESRQTFTPSPSTPVASNTPNQQYTNVTMIPIAPPPPPTQGVMGPPSKPAERPTREYEYDVSDSLAGTGIDLRAEEQALADYYAGSFAQEARTGLPANAPGGKSSMYGTGWANQQAQAVDASQEQFTAEVAKKAWEESAQRLAVTRSNEIREPFLQVPPLHYKAEKIAKEHGISLNLDLKNPGSMGKLKHPLDFPQPKVTVTTRVGPDGTMVSTSGSWIPQDAYLADQLALLSIATKHRLKELLEEAFNVSILRQTTSNADIPEEWKDVAVPLAIGLDTIMQEPESAVSPKTNPLKRSFDVANAQNGGKSVVGKHVNHLTKAIRQVGEADRKIEDARLRKRAKRANPDAAAGSRSGSVAPGTPGSVAPETETKAPSKKELKKGAAAARMAEASSTASANQTLSTLMGRKKGKQYSWMTSGGSGASTPNRLNTPGTPGSSAAGGGTGGKTPEQRPTQEGKVKWGGWRENQGKKIELRDWVTVLEMNKTDVKAVQDAYLKLDESATK